MNEKTFKELLAIDDANYLKAKGIEEVFVYYNQGFWKNLLSLCFPKFRDISEFNLHNWVIFKDGIINNLYNKGLCEIKFIKQKETSN